MGLPSNSLSAFINWFGLLNQRLIVMYGVLEQASVVHDFLLDVFCEAASLYHKLPLDHSNLVVQPETRLLFLDAEHALMMQ
jgi:hypothetical protein